MDTADVVAIVISLFALAGTGLGLWFTKDANRISKESKELSKEANDIARRAFESETVPDIKIVLGLSQDVTTSPPTDLFEIQAGNHGRLPVVIQHVGVFIVGSVITIPLVHSVVTSRTSAPNCQTYSHLKFFRVVSLISRSQWSTFVNPWRSTQRALRINSLCDYISRRDSSLSPLVSRSPHTSERNFRIM